MRAAVDADRCAGHGVCWTLCPEVFHLNDDGWSERTLGRDVDGVGRKRPEATRDLAAR